MPNHDQQKESVASDVRAVVVSTLEKNVTNLVFNKFQGAIRQVFGTIVNLLVPYIQLKVEESVAHCTDEERTVTSSTGNPYTYKEDQWSNFVTHNLADGISNQLQAAVRSQHVLMPLIQMCVPEALRPAPLDMEMYRLDPTFDAEYEIDNLPEANKMIQIMTVALAQSQKKIEDALWRLPDEDADATEDRDRGRPVLVIFVCPLFVYWLVLVGVGCYWFVVVLHDSVSSA